MRYDQPADGHRSGIEPVFLAASVPARPGERVLEAGTGAGAALLCLAHRVAGVSGVGVERNPALTALAAANFAANGFATLQAVAASIEGYRADRPFDHAMANPPWHDVAGTASPDRLREAARRGAATGWIATLAGTLRHRGTLTLVAPASTLVAWLAALPAAGCGSPAVLPLWPRAGHAAKLVLLRAIRGGRGGMRLLPGLVLHTQSGGFTPQAEAVLRDAAALMF